MLEENLRELQMSSADALASEQRRSKDLIARLEREKVKEIGCAQSIFLGRVESQNLGKAFLRDPVYRKRLNEPFC